ncbi:MAG: ribosome biogenesis GTP-binding protein YihA/YsxC [Pyrinomonadaceae bacterium]
MFSRTLECRKVESAQFAAAKKRLGANFQYAGQNAKYKFFLVNESFYFVDLPGYGYAKVSKAMRNDWGKMAEEYLARRRELALSIQLVDSRHAPTELDKKLHEWLVFNKKNHVVVATKADKLSNNKLKRSVEEIEQTLPESKIILYSAETGKGRDELWKEILNSLEKK